MMRKIRLAAYGLIVLCALAWGVVWMKDSPSAVGRFATTLAGWFGDMRGTVAGAAQSAAGMQLPGGITLGGPFSLTDSQNHEVTDATYRGRWMLVYFGYTFCPDVCPTELQTIVGALDNLGPAAASVTPIFITIDPERDTPAALADYTKLFDERIIGLTGSSAQIAAATRAYRVYYAKSAPKDAATYLMDHSSFIYLMGPDGKFRALYRQGMSPQELADGIRARMAAS
jgi:cytochrome oxidase Cu insertion factor (SCO1/SenC/PrrC family)